MFIKQKSSRAAMEYKQIAKGVKVPVIGIGTWRMGGSLERKDKSHDQACIRAIKTAIDLGMTHIDTAEVYGTGHSEELVGKAIKAYPRKKLFLTTKVSWEHLAYDEVLAAAQRSLQRLDTDYIDLYLIHAPWGHVPLKETMQAMDELVKQKKVRFIGVSNFSVAQMKKAQQHAKHKIVTNQIEYNLLVRNKGKFTDNMEKEIIPYCQKHGMLVTAYRPVARGELAKPGYPLLDELAEKYNKTQAQIAMNWLISKKNVIVIPKAVQIKHIKDNLGAVGWHVSPKDIKRLDKEFPHE